MNFVLSRRGLVLAGAALVLAGCATTPVLLAAAPGEAFPELEPLLAAKAGSDALTVRVASKGCATKADFVFRVDRHDGHAVVAFARRRLETCKGPSVAVELRFTYDELGLTHADRIVIANKVLTPSA
ncbi:hypothetical protein [Caulobacter sp. FWC2]|uniref:hypothetical protein n=1 Tax=Caulobacter sp. FWC2 TaxID=69664 RepID=UPI000C154470|nr:hypothetical protein [Caulobacter sp. FWC2]PIB93326.1 hypothetical protein CSW62_18090 [Caulobacter sp. FWC2]